MQQFALAARIYQRILEGLMGASVREIHDRCPQDSTEAITSALETLKTQGVIHRAPGEARYVATETLKRSNTSPESDLEQARRHLG